MERFNRYYAKLGMVNVHLVASSTGKKAPLGVSERTKAECAKCKHHPATHIGCTLGDEKYLCDDCVVGYRTKRENLSKHQWFCENFEEVRRIDATPTKPNHTFGQEFVDEFIAENGAKVKRWIERETQQHANLDIPIVVYVKVAGCACCKLEAECFLIESKHVEMGEETRLDVKARWERKKENLFLFINEEDRALYSAFH